MTKKPLLDRMRELNTRFDDEVGQVFPGHFRAPSPIGGFSFGIISEFRNDRPRTHPPQRGFRIINVATGEINTEHLMDLDRPDWKLLRAALREAREQMILHLSTSLQFCGIPLTNKPVLDPMPTITSFERLGIDGGGLFVVCGVSPKALGEMAERVVNCLSQDKPVKIYRDDDIPVGRMGGVFGHIKDTAKACGAVVGIFSEKKVPIVFTEGFASRLSKEMAIPFILVRQAKRFPDLSLDSTLVSTAMGILWAESHGGFLTVISHRHIGGSGTYRIIA